MKPTKSGMLAVPRFHLQLLAAAHREFAENIGTVLSPEHCDDHGALKADLEALQAHHAMRAMSLETDAAATKAGRPSKAEIAYSLALKQRNVIKALADLEEPKRANGKPGRPTNFGKPFDLATFRAVEQRRAVLAASRKTRPTIKAAIDSLNADRARDSNRREGTLVAKEYWPIRSAYQRGKNLSKKFQNPE